MPHCGCEVHCSATVVCCSRDISARSQEHLDSALGAVLACDVQRSEALPRPSVNVGSGAQKRRCGRGTTRFARKMQRHKALAHACVAVRSGVEEEGDDLGLHELENITKTDAPATEDCELPGWLFSKG
jgi:hypothetical protein